MWPKTCIRAIWGCITCGHSNAGVVWAMFILFLYGAASVPIDSVEYAKQLEIAEAKIGYAFSWQAYVIFSASIFALGALLLAICVLCVAICCYGWMMAKDIAIIRENTKFIREQKARDERKAMHAQHQLVLDSRCT